LVAAERSEAALGFQQRSNLFFFHNCVVQVFVSRNPVVWHVRRGDVVGDDV